MFGEEDVINERYYTTTVRCISAGGSVYRITSEEFFSKFRGHRSTWRTIVDHALEKDQNTKSKIK